MIPPVRMRIVMATRSGIRGWRGTSLKWAFGALFASLAACSARADLSICNKTSLPVAVAIGTYEAGEWWSNGWTEVQSGACGVLVKGELSARYYYAYAVHLGAAGAWDGNRSFCVADEPFRIQGRTDCEKRGFKRAGFFEMDTKELKTWTQYLSD